MKITNCLTINNLSIRITTPEGILQPVRNVSLTVPAGKIVGLVGESGSGKSLLARSILRLNDTSIQYQGEIWFKGQNLAKLSERELRPLRGKQIAMIFQDPLTSLNPVLPVGWQLGELYRTHLNCSRQEAKERSLTMLEKVGLAQPARVYRQFPHQLSGGMRQRVMIAMAMALKPSLIIADEPTTALDMTLQAQILKELKKLQAEFGTTILLISHDMGVIAEMADEVVVIQQGAVIEYADCCTLFDAPESDYTRRLIQASRMEAAADGF